MKKMIIWFCGFVIVSIFLTSGHLVWARSAFEQAADADGDGICDPGYGGPWYFCTLGPGDKPDNCLKVANLDQKDTDADGIGDACQPQAVTCTFQDSDGDGIADCLKGKPLDLCPPPPADLSCAAPDSAALKVSSIVLKEVGIEVLTAAVQVKRSPHCDTSLLSQTNDLDLDGIGDVCDPDIDGDGVVNEQDCNCVDPAIKGPDATGDCSAALGLPPPSPTEDPPPPTPPPAASTAAGGCSFELIPDTEGSRKARASCALFILMMAVPFFVRCLRKNEGL